MKRSPELLADGKGVTARWGLKEALGKPASRRTETSYRPVLLGEHASQCEARNHRGVQVDEAVVQGKLVLLFGEA